MSIAIRLEGLDIHFKERRFAYVIESGADLLRDSVPLGPFSEANIRCQMAYAFYYNHGPDTIAMSQALEYLERANKLRASMSRGNNEIIHKKLSALYPILLQLDGKDELAFAIIEDDIKRYSGLSELHLTKAILHRRRYGFSQESYNFFWDARTAGVRDRNLFVEGAALYGYAMAVKGELNLTVTDALRQSLAAFRDLSAANVDVGREIGIVEAKFNQWQRARPDQAQEELAPIFAFL